MNLYREQFPNYDDTLPLPPEGFADASWRNDICPSFDHELGSGATLRLWCDYKNPSLRELGTEDADNRFSLCVYDANGSFVAQLWEGADYPDRHTIANALQRARELSP